MPEIYRCSTSLHGYTIMFAVCVSPGNYGFLTEEGYKNAAMSRYKGDMSTHVLKTCFFKLVVERSCCINSTTGKEKKLVKMYFQFFFSTLVTVKIFFFLFQTFGS